jgi:hypothetical protein
MCDVVRSAPVVECGEVGPIDYVLVEFPAGTRDFGGELARELASLVDAEMIRILDMLILEKDDAGHVEAYEVEELGDRQQLRAIERELAEILAADDVGRLAEVMTPGTVAGVLIWENVWATPFAAAARESGGELVATGRLSPRAVVEALRLDEEI